MSGSAVSVWIICVCKAKPEDCFSVSGAYLTHNAAAMDITYGNLSDYKLGFVLLFLPKTCKHTLVCTAGGVPPQVDLM